MKLHPRTEDMAGKTFGRWAVIEFSGYQHRWGKQHATWLCRCSCGIVREVNGRSLAQGSKSCGCLTSDVMKARGTGMARYGVRSSPLNYAITSDTVTIPLNDGFSVVIDCADIHIVSKYKWVFTGTPSHPYAAIRWQVKKRKFQVMMHRMLMGVTDRNITIDHINGNGLDNRRCNLRIATQRENCRNRRWKPHSSIYKGVSAARGGRWIAYIVLADGRLNLGHFGNESDAAKAYNNAAKTHFGEFANINPV